MEKYSLSGQWELQYTDVRAASQSTDSRGVCNGTLPGSNYLDLMAAGVIGDPFYGKNEYEATEISKKDYIYRRTFDLPAGVLSKKHIELVISGLDTLAVITVNKQKIAETDNCFRTYRFDLSAIVKPTDNEIEILFKSPYTYMEHRQKAVKLIKNIGHLRKVQCHFGWDWGPNLPPVGIFGAIDIEGYDCRIEDFIIHQSHEDKKVVLDIKAKLNDATNKKAKLSLANPNGETREYIGDFIDGKYRFSVDIDNPELWWCNGLGNQPLYLIDLSVIGETGAVSDHVTKKIGLRTIKLDTSPDKYGTQFRFLVNDVPIFAKGANFIPTDSFVTRTRREDLSYYIESAKTANMNMLRVWGGGHYESDDFYDLCDQYGILVWQDFAFCDNSYPFFEKSFIKNVHREVIDNIRRIRHHASLAIWSGNNENEMILMLLNKKKRLYRSNIDFYYNVLRKWVDKLDGVTPYWPGSPSSGSTGIKALDIDHGDSHLWNVWHGLMPIEEFRKFPARFCSEFGVESFPSMKAMHSFCDNPDMNYLDPVVLSHQKSVGGNQKILFYLMAKYQNPKHFDDFVYLSQLVQSGAIRFATDEWRRHFGRCNGSLFWQFNDCWPVASWAGIDYLKQPKAVHYHARHFNKMVCLSNDYFTDHADIYLENDLPEPIKGTLKWTVRDFFGKVISEGETAAHIKGSVSKKAVTLNYDEILKGVDKKSAVLNVIFAGENGTIDEKNWLFVPDKDVKLPKPHFDISVTKDGAIASITVTADVFARYVYLDIDGIMSPLTDNFFDINAGRSTTVKIEVPQTSTVDAIRQAIKVKSLADIEPKGSLLADKFKRFSMRFTKINFLTWAAYKFIKFLK
jgi:beta-mannosidase